MADSNPDITAADIITDVEVRLNNPSISATSYLPWISYAYQKTFQALANVGQHVKEALFEDEATVTLTQSVLAKDLTVDVPRFGGDVKVEVKYGATGDDWNPAGKLKSSSQWANLHNVSTTYRSKTNPLYFIRGMNLNVIPVAPEAGAQAYIRYIKRPYQISEATDVIDIPYRFLYPLTNYVQAKAIQKNNEDYNVALQLERTFQAELEQIAEAAASEFNENDGTDTIEEDYVGGDPLNG